jgi:hypothetical protein
MTTVSDVGSPAPAPVMADRGGPPDHRGSWIPTGGMIATRFMELRRRRGLMIALMLVTIGIPTIFLVIRLIAHAAAPHSYGPAGGYTVFNGLVVIVLYVFGFIVAATLGCTAGSVDLTEGMFRHLVVTGRSRLALYLARIPAGLGIILSMVAAGYLIVCMVCVYAAPTQLNFDGANVPVGLSQSGLEAWAADHAELVLCDFNYNGPPPGNVQVPCGPNGPITNGPPPVIQSPNAGPGKFVGPGSGGSAQRATKAQIDAAAVQVARQDYSGYAKTFLYPPTGLMIRTGLWIELEAIVGFIVGLGLASLLGQRTVAVVLMIVLEIILTPILSRANLPHLINLQRGVVGLAVAHLEPSGLSFVFGGGGGPGGDRGTSLLVPETRTVAICVIVGWLVVWTGLGAWRMIKRDA